MYLSALLCYNIFLSKSPCVDKLYSVCVCVCVCVNPQGHGMHGHGETVHIPFPFDEEDLKAGELINVDKAIKSLSLTVCQLH